MAEAEDRTQAVSQEKASQPKKPVRRRSPVDGGKLWAGGLATAVIAALIALVGLLIVRVLLQIPYLAPVEAGVVGSTDQVVRLCVAAAIAALAATALVHLLLLTVPSPMGYFGWIIGLLTAVAAVWPLAFESGPLTVRIAQGIIHLVIGTSILSLVTQTANGSWRSS
ncbi:DUF6069 family protein [Pseudonocardia phyllosphaerae]|uniref:DUF6069 family protein n=1 Tax=Pseudonocardia phyllosphaerae TaxID=3390502 RepID=UPI00397D2DC7